VGSAYSSRPVIADRCTDGPRHDRHDARSGLPVTSAVTYVLRVGERLDGLAQATRTGSYIKVRQLSFGGNAHMLTPAVSVVVPALNEASNIPRVFARIPADVYEVVQVDGCSVDETVAIAFLNSCYGRSYSDLCYGFNVFRRRYMPIVALDATSPSPPKGNGRLWGDGFEVETRIHVRAAKAGLVVAEVPSFEYPRIHGSSSLNAFGDGLGVLRNILTERSRIWPSPVIEASPLPIRKLPGKAAHVTHETTAMPAVAAGLEQRAPDGLEGPQVRRASCLTSTDQSRLKRSCPLLKCRRLRARSVQVPTADYEPQEQVIAASNTNRHRKSLIVTSISPKSQQTWKIPARLLNGCYVHAIARVA
jgi:hypothetical protein